MHLCSASDMKNSALIKQILESGNVIFGNKF